MNRRALALLPAFLTAACATARPSMPEPQIRAEPPNARTKLYADCVGSATAVGTYERYGRYLWYTCAGAPAQALFDAGEAFSRNRGWKTVQGGRTTIRFTPRDSADRCFQQVGFAETSYGCTLTQPVGTWLDPAQDGPPPAAKR